MFCNIIYYIILYIYRFSPVWQRLQPLCWATVQLRMLNDDHDQLVSSTRPWQYDNAGPAANAYITTSQGRARQINYFFWQELNIFDV